MFAGGLAGVDISVPEHNSTTFRNILMVFGRIIEQANVECHLQDDNSACFLFQIMPLTHFFFLSFPRLAGKYRWQEFPMVITCNTVLGNTPDLAKVEMNHFWPVSLIL